jgi:hypothetical protein
LILLKVTGRNSTESGEIRVVVRDLNGHAIATLSQKVLFPFSIEATQAVVAKRAVKFGIKSKSKINGESGFKKIFLSKFSRVFRMLYYIKFFKS